MPELDHIETWLEKYIRPALPGWTRYRWWLMSPVEQDLVRVFEVVAWGTRTTLQGWAAPLCVPWEASVGLRRFFSCELPGIWGWHRPQDVPKVLKAIERFLPKLDETRTIEQWVKAHAKYLPPGGRKLNYDGDAGTFEEIALPLVALGEDDRAADLLDRGVTMAKKSRGKEGMSDWTKATHDRMVQVRDALEKDPAVARRKLAAYRRQNVKKYGLATGKPRRADNQPLQRTGRAWRSS